MKHFLGLLILLFAFSSLAQVPLVQAPGASPWTYQEFLKSHAQYISYSDYAHRQLQQNTIQEERLLRLGDSFDQDLGLTLLHLKGLQQERPLTLLSLRYMRDLSEKSLNGKISSDDRRDLSHLYCKVAVLLNEAPLSENCEIQFVSFGALKKKFPMVNQIVVETFVYSLSGDANAQLSPRTSYHWTLLGNSIVPVRFYGTVDQLYQQNFMFQNLVDGRCEGFTANLENFGPLNPAQIYFSEDCQKVSHTLPTEKSWMNKNKSWLYVAGAAALGVIVYSMKDKTLVINKGAFK